MKQWHRLVFGVVALFGITLLAACGSGGGGTDSSQQLGGTTVPADGALIGQSELGGADVEGDAAVPGRSACVSATARVGVGGNQIEFRSRCAGSNGGGSVNFAVIRHGGHGRAAIVSYTHRPRVVASSGALFGRGSCRLEGEAIECAVRATGLIVVSGHLSVAKGKRCAAALSIVGITVARCDEEFCEGGPVLHELFRGRPRGCGPA